MYNRPEELNELLQSILDQDQKPKTEIVVVEDGSDKLSKSVVASYEGLLNISYCFKNNSGPGDSRNYGMQRASGDYFIMLDSDCILPHNYLSIVENELKEDYVDAYGLPDQAHESFSDWQKAINYSMTSFLTTGGLRNEETSTRKFQLRSFNMGISKKAFNITGGFSKQRIGEDIDLNFKLTQHKFKTKLLKEAFVYHKRRTSFRAFFRQTRNFGAARPILNIMHPGTSKMSYWFPSVFIIGFIISCIAIYWRFYLPLTLYLIYFITVAIDSFKKNKSLKITVLSLVAVCIQFTGYGLGFLRSVLRLHILRKNRMETFPEMFV